MSNLYQTVMQELLFFSWRDIAEISFFILLTYSFVSWLKKDQTKSLVFAFYIYAGITFGAYYLQCTTISMLLLGCWPATLTLFIILHQHQLQKNFIAFQKITPATTKSIDWLEELMRIVLHAVNRQKHVVCFIEKNDTLSAFLEAPYSLNADLRKELCDILFEQHRTNNPLVLWISAHGKVHALDPIFCGHADNEWISPDILELERKKQDGILITAKTDAIVIGTIPQQHHFYFIVAGKLVEPLTAQQTFGLLKRTLATSNDYFKGEYHESIPKERSYQQK